MARRKAQRKAQGRGNENDVKNKDEEQRGGNE